MNIIIHEIDLVRLGCGINTCIFLRSEPATLLLLRFCLLLLCSFRLRMVAIIRALDDAIFVFRAATSFEDIRFLEKTVEILDLHRSTAQSPCLLFQTHHATCGAIGGDVWAPCCRWCCTWCCTWCGIWCYRRHCKPVGTVSL